MSKARLICLSRTKRLLNREPLYVAITNDKKRLHSKEQTKNYLNKFYDVWLEKQEWIKTMGTKLPKKGIDTV